EPVTIDQRGCVYRPRVVGVRVGQSLLVRNSDALLHNVHGLSALGNGFNVSEPAAGVVQTFRPAKEEIMLHITCDVHSWMTSYVGIVGHPYFAVTSDGGTFEIANVPEGTHTIQSWHERFGVLSQTVRLQGGQLLEQLPLRTLGGHKPLDALAGEDLTGVDVALRIDGDHVKPEPLAAVFAHAAHLSDDPAVLPIQKPEVIVREIGNEQVLLRLVG